MKTDEGTATDGNAWWSAGHHVMIAGSVVALVVTDRSNDRVLVSHRGQLGQMLADLNARHVG